MRRRVCLAIGLGAREGGAPGRPKWLGKEGRKLPSWGIPITPRRRPRLQPTLATPQATPTAAAFPDSTLGPPPIWLRPALANLASRFQGPERPRCQASDGLGLDLGLPREAGTEMRGKGASSPSVGSGKRRASGGGVNHSSIDREVSKLRAYLWDSSGF